MTESLLTLKQTAELLKVSQATVINECQKGLPHLRLGGQYRFSKPHLEAWIETKAVKVEERQSK